jgi:hypothetical protein
VPQITIVDLDHVTRPKILTYASVPEIIYRSQTVAWQPAALTAVSLKGLILFQSSPPPPEQ